MTEIPLIAGPLHLVALVLTVSGAHKLLDPSSAAQALRTAGVPRGLASGRVVGASEVVAGAGVLAFGGVLASAAVGLLYAGFAGFLFVLARRDDSAPCGCLGATDAPPGLTHLVLDLASVAVAGAALLTASPSLVTVSDAATVPAMAAYSSLLLAGTVAVFAGTTVLEEIRRTTDLMRA